MNSRSVSSRLGGNSSHARRICATNERSADLKRPIIKAASIAPPVASPDSIFCCSVAKIEGSLDASGARKIPASTMSLNVGWTC